jgi:type II secretory pathway pseudopilin PulG
MHRRNHSKGVTLLEVMLAVSLIVLGVVLGVSQYQKIILKRKVAQIQNSVILLGNALEQYYNVNCYYFLTQYAIYPINSPYTNPAIIPQPSDPTQESPPLAAYLSTPQLIGNAYAATPNGPCVKYQYAIFNDD